VPPWLGAAPAVAQPAPPDTTKPADKGKHQAEGTSLEARLKALEADLEDVKGDNEALKSEVADLKAQVAASKPPASLNALNRQITAFTNGAMRIDDKPVFTPRGAAIDDRPFLRTAEFDFRAAVDPYADAVVILSLEDQAGAGFDADVEEGYVIIKRLPVL